VKSKKRWKYRARATHERWLVSYADFITLLFAFFVVMYSTAQVDRKKVTQLSAAIQVAFQQMGAYPGGVEQLRATGQLPAPVANNTLPASAPNTKPPAPAENKIPSARQPPESTPKNPALNELQSDLEKALAAEITRGEVALRQGPDGLVVSLREVGFFDSGSAGIKPGAQPAFSRMAGILLQGNYRIRVEGHTDNLPIHNSQFTSNWELSTARSTEMIRMLITKYNFSPEMLSAAGYAEYHPIADNQTDAGRALNRRVDVVVLAQSAPAAHAKPSPGKPFSQP